MSSLSITKLFELLTAKVGRDTAEHLIVYMDDKIRGGIEGKSLVLATKEDLSSLEFGTKEQISRLEVKISETKSEIIKWMFIFWIAQVATTFGLILLFLKK